MGFCASQLGEVYGNVSVNVFSYGSFNSIQFNSIQFMLNTELVPILVWPCHTFGF